MRLRINLLLLFSLLVLSACGGSSSTNTNNAQNDISVEDSVSATLAALEEQDPPPAPDPLPGFNQHYGCDGEFSETTAWCYIDPQGQASEVTPPVEDYLDVFDFFPANSKVLVGWHQGDHTIAPAPQAVSDLWIVDLQTLEVTSVITETMVANAIWSPDGTAIAYRLATPTTFELRYRNLTSGEDKLLANDVSRDFSFSQTGDTLGFVREPDTTNLPVELGLYTVSVATGEEKYITLAGGLRRISAPHFWSADGSVVFISISFIDQGGTSQFLRLSLDNSASLPINFDPSVQDAVGADIQFLAPTLWLPSGKAFIGWYQTGLMTADQEEWVLLYTFDDQLEKIVSIEVIDQGVDILGWHVVGESIWVMPNSFNAPGQPYSVDLP